MRKHLVMAAVCATALAGCGGSGGSVKSAASPGTTTTGATSAPSTAPAQAFDPPAKFATTQSTTIPGDPDASSITLSAQAAYVSDPDALRAVSLTSGQVLWHVAPKNPAVTLNGQVGAPAPAAPVLSRNADGTSTVYKSFPVTVHGQGTTADQPAVELWAVNAATGATLWTVTLPQSDPSFGNNVWTASVIGADATAIVVQADGRHGPTSFAVSTATHQLLWSKNLFDAFGLLHNAAVGIQVPEDQTNIGAPERGQAVAVDETAGSQLWSLPDKLNFPTVTVAGSNLVAVYGDVAGTAQLQFVDAHSGTVTSTAASPARQCTYDGTSVAVCITGATVTGYDSTSGKQLWTLPDRSANRTAPSVTAVWHGAVYGTAQNGPVVLDARTGADRQDAPGIAPYGVDEYGGVVSGPAGTGGTRFYPAAG